MYLRIFINVYEKNLFSNWNNAYIVRLILFINSISHGCLKKNGCIGMLLKLNHEKIYRIVCFSIQRGKGTGSSTKLIEKLKCFE
jgi:hypothetical protein